MPKVLVGDGQEHVRLLDSEELKEAGCEVTTAEGGYKLLETIEEEKPDLVILDIKMDDYSGLDILHHPLFTIRSSPCRLPQPETRKGLKGQLFLLRSATKRCVATCFVKIPAD